MTRPKWSGESLLFQFNGIIVVLPCRAFSLLKQRLLEQQRIMWGQEACFSSGSLGLMMSLTITVLIPWFMDPWILAVVKNRTIEWMLIQSIHSLLENTTPAASYCHLAGTETVSSKGHSTVLSSPLLRWWEVCKTRGFYKHELQTSLLWLWSESLDQKQYWILWNTVTVDKVFCKSTDSNFGRNITYRERKTIPWMCLFQQEWSSALSMMKVVRHNQPVTCCMLFTLGMMPYWELSVGLCCWQMGHSAMAVAKSALVSGAHA